MSREIKFRAWYKADLELGAPIKFTMDTKDDEIKFIATDEGFSFSYPFALVFTDDNFIIEQYTGLKDKNGLEIYEGDIVRLCKSAYPCLVYWDGIGFYWLMNGRKRDIDLTISKMNIIGNIHENKELLK